MPKKPEIVPTEHQIQSAFFRHVFGKQAEDKRYKMIHAVPNGGLRSARTGAIMKREGVRKGIFDVYVMIPEKGFAGLVIETKKKGESLTPQQEEYLELYKEFGYLTAVCDNLRDMIDTLEEYLNG